MRHLESARLLFDEMGVPKRVEQVQSAIDDLKILSTPDIIILREDSDRIIIAASPELKRLVSLAENIARSNLTVLLTGETGVGKDLFARYIHDMSGREGEFVTVNAAAVPQDMIESELFGYSKGAFTGALELKAGLFERAEGGTFYLNEIADATPAFQAKLLEVLEMHEVRRLGETDKRRVDFRLIAATNRNLEQEIGNGRFRLDLFHRLNELSLVIPPLRKRPEDIAELVIHFLHFIDPDLSVNGGKKHISALSKVFSHRTWSGNVRELRTEINRLWVESRGDIEKMVSAADLSQSLSLREKLINVLNETGWNRRETARRLGVSEATVRNWIKRYNLA
jgi:transcriptional regulator with GAF, ATPase, and Fis domain